MSVITLHTTAAAIAYFDVGLMIQILLPTCHQLAYVMLCICVMHVLS